MKALIRFCAQLIFVLVIIAPGMSAMALAEERINQDTLIRATHNKAIYTVGDYASINIVTRPAAPYQPIYRLRVGGLNAGQWIRVGKTDSRGRYQGKWPVEYPACGAEYQESYRIGRADGPQSNPLNYRVSCQGQKVQAKRNAPYPFYKSGDTAHLQVTTTPPMRGYPVYRYQEKGPEAGQWQQIGTTNSNGVYSVTSLLFDGYCNINVSGERFRVGGSDSNCPESDRSLSYHILCE